jgi:hypothetical protein
MIRVNAQPGQCSVNQTFTRSLNVSGLNVESESIKPLSNGRFCAIGNVENIAGSFSPFIIVLDSLGKTLNQKVYAFPNSTIKVKTHAVMPDGGFALFGNISSNGSFTQRLVVLKLDSNLNLIWARSFGAGSFQDSKHIFSLSNGSMILSGQTSVPILYKVSSTGNVIWAKSFVNGGGGYIQKIIPDNTGFILSGSITNNTTNYYASVFKVDTNANSIIWQYVFSSFNLGDQIIDVIPLGSNNYLAGAYLHASFTNGTSDLAAIRFNSSGQVSWAKVYGGGNFEFISDINPLSDGGFLLTGFSNSFTPGANILNIKINDCP